MPDDQVQVVTDEQGVEHHFPKEATPDMISQALGLKSASQGPNLTTGAGMEQQAQQQAGQYLQQRATAPYEQQQAELQRRKNLAARWEQNNPTPATNAAIAYAAPEASLAGLKQTGLAALRTVLGGAGGAYAGGHVGQYLGGETGEEIGKLGGGLAGGYLGARGVRLPGKWGEMSDLLGVPEKEPIVMPASKSPGPYRGPSSVPKTQPNFFPWATSSASPLGNAELPAAAESQTPFPSIQPRVRPASQQEVGLVPEPRELTPADRPGAKYSVKRKDLPALAQRGEPGAADVLRNVQSKPILYEPREGTGYGGPKTTGGIPQGSPTPFDEQPLKVSLEADGNRWVSDGKNKITIPPSVPDEKVGEWVSSNARQKLAEQVQGRANFPWMKGSS